MIAEPFPTAAPHDTVRDLLPRVTDLLVGALGSPVTVLCAVDQEPNPLAFFARTMP